MPDRDEQSITKQIRKAVEQYALMTLDMPEVVYMSPSTMREVENEIHINHFVAARGLEKLFGMRMKQDIRLPHGMVVVGGRDR